MKVHAEHETDIYSLRIGLIMPNRAFGMIANFFSHQSACLVDLMVVIVVNSCQYSIILNAPQSSSESINMMLILSNKCHSKKNMDVFCNLIFILIFF